MKEEILCVTFAAGHYFATFRTPEQLKEEHPGMNTPVFIVRHTCEDHNRFDHLVILGLQEARRRNLPFVNGLDDAVTCRKV